MKYQNNKPSVIFSKKNIRCNGRKFGSALDMLTYFIV